VSTLRALVRGPCLALSLLAFALFFASPSLAQSGPDTPGYRDAIAEAITEHDAHNYIEAKALFIRAHKLYPNARTLRGLGAVSFELQQYRESVGYLEQALASKVRPLEGGLREDTERLLARARGFVAEVKLRLEPADAHVIVDGADEPVGNNEPLILPVGEHELEFRAKGFQPQRRRYRVQGGESKSWIITISLQPEQTAGSAPTVAPPAKSVDTGIGRGRRALRVIGVTSLTLGIGAFAAATALSIKRHRYALDFRAGLGPGESSNTSYSANYHVWKDARLGPYVAEAAATTLLTTGALTLLLSADREAFPWWASSLTAMAGVGLVAWGAHDVASPVSCEALDVRKCTIGQEKRDRGALVMLSSLPFLAVPITQLTRWLISPSKESKTAFSLTPEVQPTQRSFTLRARLDWL